MTAPAEIPKSGRKAAWRDAAGAQKFSDRLHQLRRKSGMTLVKVAEISGVNKSSLCRYEGGKSYPAVNELIALCKALKTTPNDLLDFVVQSQWTD